MKLTPLFAVLCTLATSVFSETALTNLPPSARDASGQIVSYTCNVAEKVLRQEGWAKNAGILMIEVDTFVDAELRSRTFMLSGVGSTTYLKSRAGWTAYDLADASDIDKLEVQLPLALGLTPEEWKQCKNGAKKVE